MSHQRLRSDHLQKDYIPVHGPLWGNSHERMSCNVSPDFVAFLFLPTFGHESLHLMPS